MEDTRTRSNLQASDGLLRKVRKPYGARPPKFAVPDERYVFGRHQKAETRALQMPASIQDAIDMLSRHGLTWGRRKGGEVICVVDDQVQVVWP